MKKNKKRFFLILVAMIFIIASVLIIKEKNSENKYYSTKELKLQVKDEIKFDIINKVKEYCENKNYNILTIDGVKVLDNVSFDIKDGEIFAFIGHNGAGKTTLLRIIAGIMSPTSGKVTIDNLNYKKNEIEIKRRMAFLTGNTKLYKDLSAKELLTMCGEYYQMNKKEIEEQIKYLTETFDLSSFLYQKIGSLSTGQTQRVSIARAIVNGPPLLIADEPTGNLDSKTEEEVLTLLKLTAKKYNQTIVMITHDEGIAQMADRIICIEDGKVVE